MYKDGFLGKKRQNLGTIKFQMKIFVEVGLISLSKEPTDRLRPIFLPPPDSPIRTNLSPGIVSKEARVLRPSLSVERCFPRFDTIATSVHINRRDQV